MPRFKKFVIEFKRAPGDCLLLTALVRDLKETYGNRYQVDVRTQFPGIWRHNPHLTKLDQYDETVCWLNFGDRKNAVDITGLESSQKGVQCHYLTYFHQEFERRTGIHVPVLLPRADLYLSKEEKARPRISGRYWVIVPGGKTDISNKWWHHYRYQEVVDQLRPWGVRFVQEGATKNLCHHPALGNSLNMVGLTSIRDMIVNIYHAEGVICGVTFQMHIAGALEKPCVVIAGGREEPWYEEYSNAFGNFGDKALPVNVPHRFLHTLGALGCCRKRGCWRRRVQQIGDSRGGYDKNLCKMPFREEEGKAAVPTCLNMIQTDHVTEALMSYYEDRTLKPIGTPTGKYRQPPEAAVTEPAPTEDLRVERESLYNPPAQQLIAEPEVIHPTERISTGQADPPGDKSYQMVPSTENLVATATNAWDSASVGGKITLCLLMFGEEHKLHRRLFNSVCRTIPTDRVELRVACNQVPLDTINMLSTFPIRKTYQNNGRRRKAQAMRDIFYDPDDPIGTRWVVWLDDSAFAKDPAWLNCLVEAISNQKPGDDVGLVGLKVRYELANRRGRDSRDWFGRGSWFAGKNFRNKLGRDAPNGDQIHLVHGNFFAISRRLLQAATIPDERIGQSGAAICIGEQAHQLGFRMKQFNGDYRYVQVTHAKAKRGLREKYPWE